MILVVWDASRNPIPKFAVVTYPFTDRAGTVILERLLKVLQSLGHTALLLSGPAANADGASEIVRFRPLGSETVLGRVMQQLQLQSKIAAQLVTRRESYSTVFFFIASGMCLPAIAARTLGRKTLLVMTGLGSKSQIQAAIDHRDTLSRGRVARLRLSSLLEAITVRFADRIVVYSPVMIGRIGMEAFSEKIRVAHEHHVDLEMFQSIKPPTARGNAIGFVGRFSEEKGILNLVDALPEVTRQIPDLTVLLGGDGPLRSEVERRIAGGSCGRLVRLPGWIPHADLPARLNEIRLLVLPSYAEGLPNIVVEAMACGTPVAATPVGAVTDLIADESTGFIIPNNVPGTIASTILRALRSTNLDTIAIAAHHLVEREYTLTSSQQSWRAILAGLGSPDRHSLRRTKEGRL